MKSRKIFWLVSILTLIGLLSVSCGGLQQPPQPISTEAEPATGPTSTTTVSANGPKPGGKLIFSLPGNPTSLDPHQSVFFFGRLIMRNIFDSLLEKDSETGEFTPGLAESWEVSADGTKITLHLKEGVTFHDGTPFDSSSMVFAFDRILDPDTASPYASSKLGKVSSYRAIDPSTFEIELSEPFAPFLDALSETALSPVSMAAVEEWGQDFAVHPVGTGPFMLQEWVPGDFITLVRNPDYAWAPELFARNGPASLDEITFRFITEASTSLALLETGEINVLFDAPPREVQRLSEDPRFELELSEQGGFVRVVVLQTEHPPFDDVRVRRAIAHALDRDAYVQTIFEGIGRPAYGPLSPVTFGYWDGVEDIVPEHDLTKARELLNEAGWTDSNGDGILDKDGEDFRVVYMDIPGIRGTTTSEFMQAQLGEVGIELELKMLDEGTFVPTQQKGEFDITGMLFPSSDPDILFTVAHSSQAGPPGWNPSFYKNPELDQWLEKGQITLDPVERAMAYAEAQRILVEDVPYVPMYVQSNPWIIASNIHDFTFDPRALPILYKVYMDP